MVDEAKNIMFVGIQTAYVDVWHSGFAISWSFKFETTSLTIQMVDKAKNRMFDAIQKAQVDSWCSGFDTSSSR